MHSSVSLSLLVCVPSTVLASVNGHHVNLEKEAREDSVKIFLVFWVGASHLIPRGGGPGFDPRVVSFFSWGWSTFFLLRVEYFFF